ncbi:MAG: flagellar biosynthesis protein FlhB [Oscillospiraceae bacterium]
MAAGGESKTEKASPKKRKDERKKGNVYKSQDIVNALTILAAFVGLDLMFPKIFQYMSQNMYKYLTSIKTVTELTVDSAVDIFKDCCLSVVYTAGPLILILLIVGVIATGAQTKFLFSADALKPKFSKINPISGLKKIISLRSIVELFKSIIKAVIIGAVIYSYFKSIAADTVKQMSLDVLSATVFVLQSVYSLVIKLSIAFIAISVIDYLYQWWEYERNIKMTKQEVKEEYKQTEGDPIIRSRIKDAQRKISQQRMMQQVPNADVIVRNPTHFAVALQYNIEMNSAPIVLAKGQDFVAFRIIEEAEKYDIPMIEDKPLARALFSEVEIGREIPPQYYTATAEILAWVYSLKKES